MPAVCPTVTFVILRIIVVVMGIILIVYATQARSGMKLNLNPVVQVIEDWGLKPLTDIKVKKVACDPATEIDLFTYTWPGTNEGSVCSGELGTATARDSKAGKLRPGCSIVRASAPVSTAKIEGTYLCGTLGGVPFAKVKRVDAAGACPAGTEACPGEAKKTPDNTLCYPTAQMSECPITDIKFVWGRRL